MPGGHGHVVPGGMVMLHLNRWSFSTCEAWFSSPWGRSQVVSRGHDHVLCGGHGCAYSTFGHEHVAPGCMVM
jgi:hypothetical protein